MPHLKVDLGDGLAGVYVNDLVVEFHLDSLLAIDDVLPDVLSAHVVRALSDIGGEDAAGVGGEERGSLRLGCVAELSGVVVGGQDGLEAALLQATADLSILEGALAAGLVAGLDTARLELGGAVGEVADLVVGLEVAALLELGAVVVARVGNGGAGQQGRHDSVGETHRGDADAVSCEKSEGRRR